MSLQIRDLRKSFSTRILFSGVSFAINPGEKVALVGANGTGKTTLMRIMLGRESADSGQVILPKEAKIGFLPQEIFLENEEPFWNKDCGSNSLWDLVAQAFSGLHKMKAELDEIHSRMSESGFSPSVQEKQERLLEDYTRLGGYTWQAKMKRILKGLGFSEERFTEPIEHFSGGWRMRAYFARLLLSDPDFLLLDEPTNYLDLASIQFLEDYLSSYSGGILVVSHDRYFLDNLATSVVALMPEGVRIYRGNYSEFLMAREQWAQEADSAHKRREREVQRVQKFIERFRYKATKASQVQSRIKMLNKMEGVQTYQSNKKLEFEFPVCQISGEVVLSCQKVSKNYGKLNVLNQVDFSLCRGDKLAIIGENGTGKSTLMRILAGQDLVFQGERKLGFRVFPAYFAQDEEISFEKEETVWERMLREAPLDMVGQLRGLLGAFLFSGDMVGRPVRALSGGEKSRLGLARLLLRPCNLLLLDEPTNHLDIDSREALLDALEEFPGTLIFVSHDRYFLDSLATRVLAIDNGVGKAYEGDYSQYLWVKKQCVVPESGGSESSVESDGGKSEARESWKARKKLNNQRQRWEKDLAAVEEEITVLEIKARELEEKLAHPIPEMSRDEISRISFEYERAREMIGKAFTRWEDLHNCLEKNTEPEEK